MLVAADFRGGWIWIWLLRLHPNPVQNFEKTRSESELLQEPDSTQVPGDPDPNAQFVLSLFG